MPSVATMPAPYNGLHDMALDASLNSLTIKDIGPGCPLGPTISSSSSSSEFVDDCPAMCFSTSASSSDSCFTEPEQDRDSPPFSPSSLTLSEAEQKANFAKGLQFLSGLKEGYPVSTTPRVLVYEDKISYVDDDDEEEFMGMPTPRPTFHARKSYLNVSSPMLSPQCEDVASDDEGYEAERDEKSTTKKGKGKILKKRICDLGTNKARKDASAVMPAPVTALPSPSPSLARKPAPFGSGSLHRPKRPTRIELPPSSIPKSKLHELGLASPPLPAQGQKCRLRATILTDIPSPMENLPSPCFPLASNPVQHKTQIPANNNSPKEKSKLRPTIPLDLPSPMEKLPPLVFPGPNFAFSPLRTTRRNGDPGLTIGTGSGFDNAFLLMASAGQMRF